MFGGFVVWVVGLLLPKAPQWVAPLLAAALPAIVELVEVVQDVEEEGEEVFMAVVMKVGDLIDNAFDDLPEWKEYPESGRDSIIKGFTELALFVHAIVQNKGKKVAVKNVAEALSKIQWIKKSPSDLGK
tara:strand:+ start:3416 stop:3802 length:387 start_codon:yes stop_codon:yes gene_type:complete